MDVTILRHLRDIKGIFIDFVMSVMMLLRPFKSNGCLVGSYFTMVAMSDPSILLHTPVGGGFEF